MSSVAQSVWESASWEEHNYLEPKDAPPLIRADVKRILSGDIEGTCEAVLLCCRPKEGSAGYVATEHVNASLHGRPGTFVLQHAAALGGDTQHRIGFIVPNSATGELEGLSGTCLYGHDEDGKPMLRLEYTLD